MRLGPARVRRVAGVVLAACLFAGFTLGIRWHVAAASQEAEPAEPLSQLMQKLDSTPAFRDKLLQAEKSAPKVGEWLSPDMAEDLRKAVLGKNWQRVDHFPAMTVAELNHSVDVAMHVAGDSKTPAIAAQLLDVGDYGADRAATVDLNQRVIAPSFAADPYDAVNELVPGVTMGDGPDPALAAMHAESARLAQVLNRMSLNSTATPQFAAVLNGTTITDPGALVAALQASGHSVTVDDDLYFANFGHLHDGTRDVMMPFWLNSQIAVPGTDRSLLLPVNHSEHQLHVRGPVVNADVSYYFGIDGKSEFRTMDSLNQGWVLGRRVFVYQGSRAVQVVDLLAQATRVYLAVRMAHPELPFGGYYRLGVCQDTNAAIELQMQGRVVLFPLTHDPQYFPVDATQLHLAARDSQFLQLMARIPSDRGGSAPAIDRVLSGLPTNDIAAITIPGLADDLRRVESERRYGGLRRTRSLLPALILLALVWLVVRRRRERRQI